MIKIIGLFCTVICVNTLLAQDKVVEANRRKLEHFLAQVKPECDSPVSECIDEGKIAKDLENIAFINKVFGTMKTYDQMVAEAGKHHFVEERSWVSGLVRSKQYHYLELGGYLGVYVVINMIDDKIVGKFLYLQLYDEVRCGAEGKVLAGHVDYAYLLSRIVGQMHFPVKGCPDCSSLSSDVIDTSSIAEMQSRYPGLQFRGGGDAEARRFFTNLTYGTVMAYEKDVAPGFIVELMEKREYGTIVDLLFSPNYTVALGAAEGLVYLSDRKAFRPGERVNRRMQEVFNGRSPFWMPRDEIEIEVKDSYQALGVKKEAIIGKFAAALREDSSELGFGRKMRITALKSVLPYKGRFECVIRNQTDSALGYYVKLQKVGEDGSWKDVRLDIFTPNSAMQAMTQISYIDGKTTTEYIVSGNVDKVIGAGGSDTQFFEMGAADPYDERNVYRLALCFARRSGDKHETVYSERFSIPE